MSDISKGVHFNVQQTLLKEKGPDSLGVLPEDTMQELLTGVISIFPSFYYSFQSFLMFGPAYPGHFNSISSFFLHLGLNLWKLATHLEEKAAQLRCEGQGQIKIALARTDTSSLLEILQGYFGHVDTSESNESAEDSDKGSTTEEKTPQVIENTPTTLPDVCGLSTVELVFPLKSIPTVVASLPESYLPLHGPEILSQY